MADINIGPTKAEDSPHVSGDQGVMALGVRNDAGAALAADGDYIPLSTDSTGALRTTSTGGSSGTEYDEDTPHVSGDKVTMAGVVQQTADAALAADGDRAVMQVDANGFLKVNVKSGGSAVDLGKIEDTPHSSGDVGVMMLAVRNDLGIALAGAAGDYIPLNTDANGALRTHDDFISARDTDSFNEGTSTAVAIAGAVNDAIGIDVNEDEIGIIRITPKRAQHVNLRSNAGAEVGTAAAPLRVDPTGTTTQPVSIVGSGGSTQYAEDTAHVSGDLVTLAGVVQQAADAALSTDGDRSVAQVDATGFLKVNVKTGTVAVSSITTSVTPGTAATNLGKAEDSPHASADVGVMALAVRNDAGVAFGADGDYVPISVDSTGAIRTIAALANGGTTQYSEDTAHVSGDQLTMSGVVQQSADAALSSDGDRSVLQVDGTGFAKVNVKTSALPTGAATLAEQQTQTASLSVLDDWDESDRAKVNPIAGQAGVQGGSGVVTALTQRVVLATDVGLPAGSAALGSVSISAITPGTGATSLGKAEDAVHASGDVGVMALAVRQDVAAALAATGDYIPLTTHADGSLRAANNADQATSIRKTLDWPGAITASTLWDPAAGLRFVLTDLVLSCSGASIVTIFEDTDTTVNRVAKVSIAANGGFTMNYTKPIPGVADNILKVTVTGAGAVGFITVSGYEV